MGTPLPTKRPPAGKTKAGSKGKPSKKKSVIDHKWLTKKYFLHQIPVIMDRSSWRNGAKFQRLWMSLPARRRTPSNIKSLYVDDTTIKMSWVLGFARARTVYDGIVRRANAGTLWDKKAFKKLLMAAEKKKKPGSKTFSFPPNKDVSRLRRWQLTEWIGAAAAVGGMNRFDGLLAALARFAFLVIPIGTATGSATKGYKVQVEKFAVFILDSFDFNDNPKAVSDARDVVTCRKAPQTRLWGAVKAWVCSQPLGIWNLKERRLITPNSTGDKFRIWYRVGYTFSHSSVEKRQKKDMSKNPKATGIENIYIGNATYRNYRKHTRRGGDFIIFSDVKSVTLPRTANGRKMTVR